MRLLSPRTRSQRRESWPWRALLGSSRLPSWGLFCADLCSGLHTDNWTRTGLACVARGSSLTRLGAPDPDFRGALSLLEFTEYRHSPTLGCKGNCRQGWVDGRTGRVTLGVRACRGARGSGEGMSRQQGSLSRAVELEVGVGRGGETEKALWPWGEGGGGSRQGCGVLETEARRAGHSQGSGGRCGGQGRWRH